MSNLDKAYRLIVLAGIFFTYALWIPNTIVDIILGYVGMYFLTISFRLFFRRNSE